MGLWSTLLPTRLLALWRPSPPVSEPKPPPPTMSTYEAFVDSFEGDLVTPGHAEYAAALHRWAVNAERKAKLIAFVRNAEDVSRAVKYARANKLPIAVRGGGHSASGASSSEGGLVIDLSRYLNGARIDVEKKLGYVGGGAIWETVDKEAIAHGLATVGGTVNHVSIVRPPSILARTQFSDARRPVSEGECGLLFA